MGAVRHAPSPPAGGTAPPGFSRWRRRCLSRVWTSSFTPGPAGSEVLRGTASGVRRLRTPDGQRKVHGGKTNPARRVSAGFCKRGSQGKRLLPSVSAAEAAPTPRSRRRDEDAKIRCQPSAASESATAVAGYDQKTSTELSLLRRWGQRR